MGVVPFQLYQDRMRFQPGHRGTYGHLAFRTLDGKPVRQDPPARMLADPAEVLREETPWGLS